MIPGKGPRGAEKLRGIHVLDRLRDEGAITSSQYTSVVHQAQRSGERIEEALIDAGVMREGDLLKYLAAVYQTRFVSTDKLSKARLDRRTLAALPPKIAERLQVCPIVYDAKAQSLAIVCASPGEDDVEKHVQIATGLREVKCYVARPSAIRAAIAKFYNGDDHAFSELVQPEGPDFGMLDVVAPQTGGAQASDADMLSQAPPPPPKPSPVRVAPAAPLPAILPFDVPLATSAPRIETEAYLETLNVFVALLERERGELRGHSAQVAQLCKRIAERADLPAADRHALLVAAYLHDVGKVAGIYHLTALNVARYEGHRMQATRTREAPLHTFASAGLPSATAEILAHLYERFDGQGFPDRLAGKDIPFGARVLAIVETFADLTSNSRNPYRRLLNDAEAAEVVRGLGGTLFDPALGDLLRLVVIGDANEAKGDRPRALLVDPDAEDTTVLEMRLIEHGFRVLVARDLASAKAELEREPPAVVISEVDLGDGPSGFDLLRELPEPRPLFLFLTARSDRESVAKGFELGAADYVVKPASPDVVAAKAEQLAAAAARPRSAGVSGSLREMALPDVVQILANGRKSGRLVITGAGKRGEVHFQDGQIYNASFGDARGEEAVYAMLKLADGNFSLDPSFVPTERVIHASAEGLLLEGMRRLDEGI
ncbi:MAG: DUF4388 domain-containing protein [Sandaracinaceae bacterium]|nr:DUF4388 domain-containing protein [Sandaracinaceae bacterium]